MRWLLWIALALGVAGSGLQSAALASASGSRHLVARWTARTGGAIAAKPLIANKTAYVGSWNGYEYAYSERSGKLLWRSFLGVTRADCDGNMFTQGVTSSPALVGGRLYLGGGGPRWYALNATTGRRLWSVPTGDNSPTGGHYNWSSPVVYRQHAYIGIASLGDCPLVQGELLRVNIVSHAVENVWKVVPDGHLGGTIWTNPVVDPATNTVFVTTGNRPGADTSEPYAESVVALDASTLAVKSYWSLPASEAVGDSDWGTSPTFFQDSRGRPMLAAANKNGILYAFLRNGLSAGPIWQTAIAQGGADPLSGDGSVSNGVFAGDRLYFAGGGTTIEGRSYGGSVRAIDPDSGRVIWAVGLPSPVLGALAGAGGLIAVPDSDGTLYVLSMASGKVLYRNTLTHVPAPYASYGAPTIADGYLVIGTTDGVVHAFAFPPAAKVARRHKRRNLTTASG